VARAFTAEAKVAARIESVLYPSAGRRERAASEADWSEAGRYERPG